MSPVIDCLRLDSEVKKIIAVAEDKSYNIADNPEIENLQLLSYGLKY